MKNLLTFKLTRESREHTLSTKIIPLTFLEILTPLSKSVTTFWPCLNQSMSSAVALHVNTILSPFSTYVVSEILMPGMNIVNTVLHIVYILSYCKLNMF